jgi:hypothetical protein
VWLIWSGTMAQRLPAQGRFLAWRPVVFIGLISYSLYLWHWPLFSFSRYQSVKALPELHKVLLITVSLVLAVISWRFVETPFRTRQLLPVRSRLFAAAAAAFVVVFGGGLVLLQTQGFASRLTPDTQIFADTAKFDQSYVQEMDVDHVPDRLLRLGDTNKVARPQLLVWGDSHAMAILPAIDAICRELGGTAVAATHAATPPVVGYFSRNEWGLNERSLPFNAAVLEHVKKEKIPSVLLVSYWGMHCTDPAFQAALKETAAQLRAAGTTIYLMRDLPHYEYDIQKSVLRYSYKGLDMTSLGMTPAEFEARDKFPKELLQELRDMGVQVLEPVPVLMARSKSDKFLPYDAAGCFYYDSNHLSTYGSLALKPLFEPIFRTLVARDSAGPAADGPATPQAQLR